MKQGKYKNNEKRKSNYDFLFCCLYSLRLMIYMHSARICTFGDDMPLQMQWIKKTSPQNDDVFFGTTTENRTPISSVRG